MLPNSRAFLLCSGHCPVSCTAFHVLPHAESEGRDPAVAQLPITIARTHVTSHGVSIQAGAQAD